MKISTKGRYALRLMLDLALNSGGELVRIRTVAERQELSEKYLEQIRIASEVVYSRNHNDDIKRTIMEHGGVYTTYYHGSYFSTRKGRSESAAVISKLPLGCRYFI